MAISANPPINVGDIFADKYTREITYRVTEVRSSLIFIRPLHNPARGAFSVGERTIWECLDFLYNENEKIIKEQNVLWV